LNGTIFASENEAKGVREMETNLDHSVETGKSRSMRKHIISYVVMMLISIAAFWMVANQLLTPVALTVILLIMASILVLLQLADFMHLDQKGHLFPTIFIGTGIFWGIIFILVILLWP
jgi:cytochrome c oxidase subunit 4